MTYRTLMVHADIGGRNEELFRLAADLAERFDAKVIGIAACMPPEPLYYTDLTLLTDYIEQDRFEIQRQVQLAEQTFRSAFASCARSIEWHVGYHYEPVATYLARQARAADLIIIDRKFGDTELDASRRVAIPDLLTAVGRPVLVAQADEPVADFSKVIIGWKDTREAQRAVAAALPLLKIASQITVVSIAAENELSNAHEAVKEVTGWLKQHGIAAAGQPVLASNEDAFQLEAIARERDAGLVIAGAYGHSRLREWVMGGVTRDLVLHSERCAFLSH